MKKKTSKIIPNGIRSLGPCTIATAKQVLACDVVLYLKWKEEAVIVFTECGSIIN